MSKKIVERRPVIQPVKEQVKEPNTAFYTIKGQQEDINEKGFPIQSEENHLTYAKEVGLKKMLRVDDRGDFINPMGFYTQKNKLDRWVSVSDEAFTNYLTFLKTKNVLFFNRTRNTL